MKNPAPACISNPAAHDDIIPEIPPLIATSSDQVVACLFLHCIKKFKHIAESTPPDPPKIVFINAVLIWSPYGVLSREVTATN